MGMDGPVAGVKRAEGTHGRAPIVVRAPEVAFAYVRFSAHVNDRWVLR